MVARRARGRDLRRPARLPDGADPVVARPLVGPARGGLPHDPGPARARRRRPARDRPRGERRLRFLPNAFNDFIFAEHRRRSSGCWGRASSIVLFLALAYSGMRVALAAPDTFGALLAAGITAWLCIQAFINIGVVVALFPITGITLPFMSAGGSSLIISFAAVGILLSISRETVEKGTWNDDATADRGRRDGRAHLPGSGRRPVAARPIRTLLSSLAGRPPRARGGPRPRRRASPCAGWRLAPCAPSGRRSPRRPRPDPARRLGAAGGRDPGQGAARGIFTTGGYVAVPVLMAAAPLRIPVVLWDGNVIPGRAVRATARLADALAVSFEATCAALHDAAPRVPCYRHRDADPRHPGDSTASTRASDWTCRPDDRVLLIFGGSQAVRRFNAAVAEALPRLVERVHVIHVTGDERVSPRRSPTAKRLPADVRDRYRPYPFLRDDMLAALVAADLVVGRAGSSTLAEVTALGLPMVIVPYPHAAGHQRANARVLVDAGAARLVDDEAFDADALVEAADILDDPARHLAMSAAARALGRPGAADAVAELVLAAAERRPLPDRGRDRPACSRGIARVTAATGRSTRSRSAPRSSGGSGSRRRATSRWRASRRCASAARPTCSRRPQPSSSCGRSSGSPAARDLPHFLLGRGSDLVIADAGIRGLVIQDRAEGSRIDGDRYIAEAGVPMARAATETQKAGLTGLEFGLAIPGTVGGAVWANAGAHDGDVAAVLESASVLAADGTEGSLDGGGPRASPTATAASSTSRRAPPELVLGRDVPPDAGRPRRDRGAPRRDPALAPRPTSRSGSRRPGSVFRNPPGDSAGRAHRGGRAEGPPDRRRGRVREARELHRQRPEGHGRRRPRPARRGRAAVVASEPGSTLELGDRVPRRLARLGAADRDRRPAPPVVVLLGGPSAEHDVSIVSGHRDRRRPRRRAATPSRQVLIDLDGALVVAARRPSPRRPARRPPTTTRRRSARPAR